MYQWCKSLVWMILVERGKVFLEFSPCYRDRAYIKANIVGPDVSKQEV